MPKEAAAIYFFLKKERRNLLAIERLARIQAPDF